MEDIDNMAANFWLEYGEAPTHLLMTSEQHKQFSSQFVPKEASGRNDYKSKLISSVGLKNGISIDIISCVTHGRSNKYPELPKLMKL